MWGGVIKPMDPVLYKEIANFPGYHYQVKWDGVRMLTFIRDGQVRLQNKKLNDRTQQYPELGQLSGHIKGREAIVDGEVVVLDQQGRPSFPRVIKRDFATQPSRIRSMMATLPVVYAIFDVLWVDGQSLVRDPWIKRQQKLLELVEPTPQFHVCESFEDGVGLFAAIQVQGMEGIVAKDLNSPYIYGKKSEYWRKVKNFRQAQFLVGGVTLNQGRVSALLLGAYHQGELIYVGSAGSGLGGQHAQLLQANLSQLQVETAAFVNPPRLPKSSRVWFEPTLGVRIEYLEWTEDFKLRAPVIKEFIAVNSEECQI